MAGRYDLGTIEGVIRIGYKADGTKQAKQDLDDVKSKGSSIGPVLLKTGKAVAAGSAVIAAGLLLAGNSAATFESKLSGIQAVSGATAEDMQNVRDKALQLGKDTKFSAGEAADAISELAKAGVSLPDILHGAADATVALAAAGEVDLPQAATIASNAMNAFGLAARDLPRVADLIAGAANASAIDVAEFGHSLQQSGAVAHLAGISFDDLSVAIAELGNAGIKGSDAGTSLKTFLQNLIPSTKQQIELSKKLGLITKQGTNAFFDQHGKVKDLASIAQILQNAMKGMGKEQKLATLQTLFGSDAIRAAAIISEGGADGFNKLAASMGKVKAADVAKTRMDNLKGSVEQLKGSAETLAIVIGEVMQGALRGATDGLNRFLGFLIEFAKNLPQIIQNVRTFIGDGLDRLRKAWNTPVVQQFIGAIVRLVAVLKGPITSLLHGMIGPVTILAKIIGGALLLAFHVIAQAMDTAADAAEFITRNWGVVSKVLVGVAAVAGPAVLILTAQIVALGVAALVSSGRQVTAWVLARVATVRETIVMLAMSARLIASWLAMGVEAIASAAIIVGQWILMGTTALIQGARVAAAWLLALGPIGLVIAAVVAAVALILLNFDKVKKFVGSTVNAIVDFMKALPSRVFTAIGGLGSLLFVKGIQLFTGMLNGVKQGFTNLINFLRGIPSAIGRVFADSGRWLFQAGVNLIIGFINGIRSMANTAVNEAKNIAARAVGGFLNFLHISSPSRLMHDIGMNTVLGFINGMSAMRSRVASTAAGIAQQAVPNLAMSSALNASVASTAAASGRAGGFGGFGGAAAASGARSINVAVYNPPSVPAERQVVTAIRQVEALYGRG